MLNVVRPRCINNTFESESACLQCFCVNSQQFTIQISEFRIQNAKALPNILIMYHDALWPRMKRVCKIKSIQILKYSNIIYRYFNGLKFICTCVQLSIASFDSDFDGFYIIYISINNDIGEIFDMHSDCMPSFTK